ncbi:MAG: beta-galactosidase GalB [Massilibacteroides sp.]|nr:beta-galactosidase GalB [Massilibacteroides sp.]
MKKLISSFLLLFVFTLHLFAQIRTEILLEKNWKFTREDCPESMQPGFDDSKWQSITVPHDWAIYGPFRSTNDLQRIAIEQDGQNEAQEHAGRTGGLPFVGVGWYRTQFEAPLFTSGKRASILFDGAMSNATVYLNGKKVGYWAYGYNSFHFDITRYMKPGEKNTLAVRLENLSESSRWYPGAGLYRNVHIWITEDAHIPVWGTQITTPIVKPEFARVLIKTKIDRPGNKTPEQYTLKTEIWNENRLRIVETSNRLHAFDEDCFNQEIIIQNPSLWSPERPSLYTAVSRLYDGETLKDEYTTTFGIRSIEIIPDQGFFLNGEKIQFKGVCNHHDLGPLGAAVNDAAIRRQIRILKDMGANAIRTSHNMPAPELVRACDEMGMMVMAESFDEWNIPKCKNGYNLYFDEWAEKDLVNLIHHFRNNPSVVMWCIGNEVPNQSAPNGGKVSRFLQDICHREDPTRPVTQGLDRARHAIDNNYASVMDIVGFNYRLMFYQEAYAKLPQAIVLGSETASTVSSRGVYKFPVERKALAKYDDHQSSGYDLEHCDWSNLPEDDFIHQEDLPYCIGEFVWTGFDYLGEPTPYYTDWPSHSSLFGIIDLAGIPKDRYFLYRSHWNKTEKTLHILPHWTWPGREGEVTPVFVYTNYPSAELFVNGKSQGKQTKNLSVDLNKTDNKEAASALERQKRYRLMWMNVKYEPGTLKVVAYDKEGNAIAEQEVHTAGKPHHIELSADRTHIQANGKDLSFVNVRVVDKQGNLCPDATNKIKFKVRGAGSFRAAANGNSVSLEPFHLPEMKLFSGQLTAIVSSSETPGVIYLDASSSGVKEATIEIVSSIQ